MNLQTIQINCQEPLDGRNINRTVTVIECSISTNTDEYRTCLEKATQLAALVNQAAANDAELRRGGVRRASDAIMGVLAEEGWLQFINSRFGDIASYTEFDDPTAQIDLELPNGEKIEIRSSYVRNGVKFAVCNDRYNFKNIGPYSNTVKPGEVQKDLYLAVLFDQDKSVLLQNDVIRFYLMGGSTWHMMETIGYNDALTPYDSFTQQRSSYKVIQLKNALDAEQVVTAISNLGYQTIAR